jgi:hypothetical protein
MSAVVVIEILGITGAAVGMALAQSPPRDLRAWWARQEWLQELVMPDARYRSGEPGLTILPWNGEDDAVQSDGAGTEPPPLRREA